MNNWKLKIDKKLNYDFLNKKSIENIHLNKGINFLIGENNSGKTLLAKLLKSNKVRIEDENGIIDNIIFFGNESRNIEDENKKENRIFKGGIFDFFERIDNKEEDITFLIKEVLSNENVITFLENKKLVKDQSWNQKIKLYIDEIESEQSGDGEKRLHYIIYILFLIKSQLDDIYSKFINFEKLVSLMKTKIDLPENLNFISYLEENSYFGEENGGYVSLGNIEPSFKKSDLITFLDFANKSLENEKLRKYTIFLIHYFLNVNTYTYFIDEDTNETIKYKEITQYNDLIKNFQNKPEYIKYNIKSFEYLKWIVETFDIFNDLKINDNKILIIIDEPENYLHQTKYKLLNDIFEEMFNFDYFKLEIRLLILTHNEKIVNSNSEFIENINFVWKDKNKKINYKNIFNNNNIESFIDDIKKGFNFYFKKELDNTTAINKKIIKNIEELNKDYIKWFLTSKENLKLFFSKENLIVEGYHDKLILSNIFKNKNIIETDGTHLGIFIWIMLIVKNNDYFYLNEFLIDLDYLEDNDKYKEHTYLLRKYIFILSLTHDNIVLYSSLYNDSISWIRQINNLSKVNDNFKKIREKYDLIVSENNDDWNKVLDNDKFPIRYKYNEEQWKLLAKKSELLQPQKKINDISDEYRDFWLSEISKKYANINFSEWKNIFYFLKIDTNKILSNKIILKNISELKKIENFIFREHNKDNIIHKLKWIKIDHQKNNIFFIEYNQYKSKDDYVLCKFKNYHLDENDNFFILEIKSFNYYLFNLTQNNIVKFLYEDKNNDWTNNVNNIEVEEIFENVKIYKNKRIKSYFKIINSSNKIDYLYFEDNHHNDLFKKNTNSFNWKEFNFNNNGFAYKIFRLISLKYKFTLHYDVEQNEFLEKSKEFDFSNDSYFIDLSLDFNKEEKLKNFYIGPIKYKNLKSEIKKIKEYFRINFDSEDEWKEVN